MITIEPINSRAMHRATQWFAVKHNDNVIGTIRKMPEDQYTKTPWQAFRGIGEASRLAGSFFGRKGKEQAIAAVAQPMADYQRHARLNRNVPQ